MTSPPVWLADILADQGRHHRDGISRRVRLGSCRGCARAVLRGLDGDRAASPAVVDPDLLNTVGEVHALLEGRRTYRLWHVTQGYELTLRFLEHIKGMPADKCPDPIFADHECGAVK